MPRTLVIQSHRSPLPYAWLEHCLASVRDWCARYDYEYRFMGDELFECLPDSLREKTRRQPVVATDLARLRVLQQALAKGYERVVWMDADFLVFRPEQLSLPEQSYAAGREVWVQRDGAGKLKVYRKVHNAFLLFARGNSFLDFYADTAQRLLTLNDAPMPPQFIGPKLLTALHNLARLPVLECAGMLSPLVIGDMLAGSGPALELFRGSSSQPIAAANLCVSSCDKREVSEQAMEQLIERLLAKSRAGHSEQHRL
jgi:hypothetical protein